MVPLDWDDAAGISAHCVPGSDPRPAAQAATGTPWVSENMCNMCIIISDSPMPSYLCLCLLRFSLWSVVYDAHIDLLILTGTLLVGITLDAIEIWSWHSLLVGLPAHVACLCNLVVIDLLPLFQVRIVFAQDDNWRTFCCH